METEIASSIIRITAYEHCGNVRVDLKDWPEACKTFEDALYLLKDFARDSLHDSTEYAMH